MKKRKSKNYGVMRELWMFMKENKKWWLLPIIIMLILVGILIVLGQSTPLSPFIYPLI
ncbi:hypothetical protein H8D36_02725 [archaeon]|nr:hypothetical protein [archaeon]MBL7057347.1 hypothetical protein [Candidatus Woesearchaeota archaeon]